MISSVKIIDQNCLQKPNIIGFKVILVYDFTGDFWRARARACARARARAHTHAPVVGSWLRPWRIGGSS